MPWRERVLRSTRDMNYEPTLLMVAFLVQAKQAYMSIESLNRNMP